MNNHATIKSSTTNKDTLFDILDTELQENAFFISHVYDIRLKLQYKFIKCYLF